MAGLIVVVFYKQVLVETRCEISSKQNLHTVRVLNFVVYKFSWISWYPLIHENLYTMKINI